MDALKASRYCRVKELKGVFRDIRDGHMYTNGILLEHPIEKGYWFYCITERREVYVPQNMLVFMERIEE